MAKRPRPTFEKLKSNYKTSGTHHCSMSFPNTCAIRMSEALAGADPAKVSGDKGFIEEFKKSGKNVCPHKYVRGAQNLASILFAVWGPRDLGWESPGAAPAGILGKRGVVCYMNIPSFGGQGHIDLWDGRAPVGSAYWAASPIWFWALR